MMTFGKVQPKDGDPIVHCGHLDDGLHFHWFGVKLEYRRPDGSNGHAKWYIQCERCFEKAPGKVVVRGDGTWMGDDPIIEAQS